MSTLLKPFSIKFESAPLPQLNQKYRVDGRNGSIMLHVKVDTQGNITVVLNGTNRNILSSIWCKGSVKVLVDVGDGSNEKLEIGAVEFDWTRIPSRIRAGFVKVVVIMVQKETTFDTAFIDGIQPDLSNNEELEAIDNDIENAGKQLKRIRILYGEESEEYKESSNALREEKQKRQDVAQKLETNEKLKSIEITCQLESDPPEF
jgi:hypothetical protein